jgi:hypothetical protein
MPFAGPRYARTLGVLASKPASGMGGILYRCFGNIFWLRRKTSSTQVTLRFNIRGSRRGALAGCVMEHRGVRFELRRALGNDEWVWTVYTPAPRQGNVSGDRYFAMQRAMNVIDRWCGRNAESVPPQTTQDATMGRHERL